VTEQPTLDVEMAEVADLVVDPHNARRHPEAQLAKVAASFERFGQTKPIVVHGSTVIAGNGSLEAVRRLGWDRIAVIRLPESWTDAEVRAFAIADNRTSDLAEWDYAELVDSLGRIGDEDLIAASGYTVDEYDSLVAKLQEGAFDEQGGESGGVRSTPSLADYGERYADKATRLLVCEFPNGTYVWLVDRLRDLRADLGVTNNADVVAFLVAERFGEQLPPRAEPSPAEAPTAETG